MSAGTPLSGTPSRSDWLFVAQIANAIYGAGYKAANAFLPAVAPPTSVQPIVVTSGTIAGIAAQFAAFNLVVLASPNDTDTIWPATYFMDGQTQIDTRLIPPHTLVASPVDAATLGVYYGAVKNLLQTWTGPTVFAGYGRYGAVAVESAARATLDGLSVQGVYTIGAPQSIGTGAALNALAGTTFQLQADTDVFTAFYPSPSSTLPSPNPNPYPWNGNLANLLTGSTPLGTLSTIDVNGLITAGGNLITPVMAIDTLLKAAPISHAIGEYLRRLTQQWPQPGDLNAGANGYTQPWIIGQLQQPSGVGVAPLPTPSNGTTKGTITAAITALACVNTCG